MAKACVIVLIGLPGAGKTTFCTRMKQKLQLDENFQCHTIIYDDIIQESYQNQYKESRKQAFKAAESIIESIVYLHNPSIKHLIFIDDNMYYRSMRHKYHRLAKKHQLSFLQVFLDVHVETALARNASREQRHQIPEAVVRDMTNKLEAPEQQWELNSITLNANVEFDETIYSNFFEVLHKCLANPVQDIIKVESVTMPVSKLQSIDLLLRKIVHEKLKQDNTRACVLVKRKKEIYQNIREGQTVLSEAWSETVLLTFLENLFCEL